MSATFATLGLVQSQEGLPRVLMDCFDVGSKTIAIVAGIIAASKAIIELRNSREQRVQELRWKKSSMAREILGDIHGNEHAMAAIEMLDWGDGRHLYCPTADCEIKVGEADVVRALAKPRTRATARTDEFVWESFDWLFYFMDRIEHHIETGFLEFSDIRDVFRPYVAKVRAERARYDMLIRSQDYRNVDAFLRRFEDERPKGGGA